MKIGLFLGAGASVPYDKPTTKEFKNTLTRLDTDDQNMKNILNTFLNNKEFHDIEHILQAINELINLKSSYAGKYLSRKNEVGSHVYLDEQRLLQFITQVKKIKAKIEKIIFEKYAWQHEFDDKPELILTPLFDIMSKHSSNKIIIYTTNYDQAIEQYVKNKNSVEICDGFIYDSDQDRHIWHKDNLPSKIEEQSSSDLNKFTIFLYKLHGSLTWKEHRKYGIEKIPLEGQSSDPNHKEDLVIYPTISPKDELSIEPYSTIFQKFSETLKTLDVCIVIGFSFRDKNITEQIVNFIKRKNTLLIVISPSAANDVAKQLTKDTDWKDNGNKTQRMGAHGKIACLKDSIRSEEMIVIQKYIDTVIRKYAFGQSDHSQEN